MFDKIIKNFFELKVFCATWNYAAAIGKLRLSLYDAQQDSEDGDPPQTVAALEVGVASLTEAQGVVLMIINEYQGVAFLQSSTKIT